MLVMEIVEVLCPHKLRCRVGFTIVELLVVIAVLALLLAILFPIYARTRELPYRVQCANNMRQLGTAFTLYAQDWDNYWPGPGGKVGDWNYWAQSGNGGLQSYVRQRGLDSIWCCPLLNDWHGKYPARSYSMNSYLRTPCDREYTECVSIIRGINLCRISAPHKTILLFEGIPQSKEYQDKAYSEDQIYYIFRCTNWTWVKGFCDKVLHTIDPGHPWHGRVNNYLYCDGHIAARPPGRTRKGTELSAYWEMYQWYVDKAYFARKYAKYAP